MPENLDRPEITLKFTAKRFFAVNLSGYNRCSVAAAFEIFVINKSKIKRAKVMTHFPFTVKMSNKYNLLLTKLTHTLGLEP